MEMARHVSLNALCLSKPGLNGSMFQRGPGRGKWRISALHKWQLQETVNAQRRPLTEITPLYNPMPLLYGGQEVKREHCRSADKQT